MFPKKGESRRGRRLRTRASAPHWRLAGFGGPCLAGARPLPGRCLLHFGDWRRARSLADADQIHGMRCGRIGHEPMPDAAGKQVLRAQQRDAYIDADHIGIEPFQGWIVAIHETIAAEHAVPETFLNGLERRNGDVGGEHEGSPGRGWSHGSIHGIERFNLSVDSIALVAVRRGDTPDVFPKSVGQIQIETVLLIGARSVYGVREEIHKAAIAAVPEIDPGLRVLMREWRA